MLPRPFYLQDTLQIAQKLLGKILVFKHQNQLLKGKIVETEAYLGEKDLACHASKGKTPRTKVMYSLGGHAYVYLIYGIYHMFNVVTQNENQPEAILIRALEPLEGLQFMKSQFHKNLPNGKLCNGPGKLTKAFQITLQYNSHDLLHEPLFIENPTQYSSFQIVRSKRVGISYAKNWSHRLFRFYIKDHPCVSNPS